MARQNKHESFNGIFWQILPKSTFTEIKSLQLGASLAVLQFNKGMKSVIEVLEAMGRETGKCTLMGLNLLAKERINDSLRHSLPDENSSSYKAGGF